jgi:hypothetical protein
MSQGVTTGVFTLGGVLAGGLINYLVTARLEARRGRRSLKATARLVSEEIDRTENILFACSQTGTWLPMQSAPLRMDATMENHQPLLAHELRDNDWHKLRPMLRHFRTIERTHRWGATDRPATPLDMNHFEHGVEQAKEAQQMLDRYPLGRTARTRRWIQERRSTRRDS